MGQPPDKEKPGEVRSDRLLLDFGKNVVRVDQTHGPAEPPRRKRIPGPGRDAPATAVPEAEVLNPQRKKDD